MDRDWASPRIVLVASATFLGLYTVLLTAVDSAAIGLTAGLVKGLADAGAGIVLPYAHASLYGRRHNGAIFAANRAMGVVASGVGPLCFGVARDRLGAFRGARAPATPLRSGATCTSVAPAPLWSLSLSRAKEDNNLLLLQFFSTCSALFR